MMSTSLVREVRNIFQPNPCETDISVNIQLCANKLTRCFRRQPGRLC
jgi:hypothetical protein